VKHPTTDTKRILNEIALFVTARSTCAVEAIQVWDIITALRAFDCHQPLESVKEKRLKELTTGRIRGLSGICPWAGSMRTTPLTPDEQAERDVLLYSPFVADHFRGHYINAVVAIRHVYGYDLKFERALEEDGDND